MSNLSRLITPYNLAARSTPTPPLFVLYYLRYSKYIGVVDYIPYDKVPNIKYIYYKGLKYPYNPVYRRRSVVELY